MGGGSIFGGLTAQLQSIGKGFLVRAYKTGKILDCGVC